MLALAFGFARIVLALALLAAGPLAVVALDDLPLAGDWRTASHQVTGLAPSPEHTRDAVVQVYAARAFRWRGAFGVHTWIAVKAAHDATYTIYEVLGWNVRRGRPAVVARRGRPDREWYGARPVVLAELRGAAAERAIGKIEARVAAYPFPFRYSVWPGPNSNTFTAFVARGVPELALDLPPTAIGKDYLGPGRVAARPPGGRGVQISWQGLAGVLLGPAEGLEVNMLGLSFGVDLNPVALRLPGVGRVGLRAGG